MRIVIAVVIMARSGLATREGFLYALPQKCGSDFLFME